jgi:hypothetical protein
VAAAVEAADIGVVVEIVGTAAVVPSLELGVLLVEVEICELVAAAVAVVARLHKWFPLVSPLLGKCIQPEAVAAEEQVERICVDIEAVGDGAGTGVATVV